MRSEDRVRPVTESLSRVKAERVITTVIFGMEGVLIGS
jgi:hypothetical protein